jgi:hypothetical protein
LRETRRENEQRRQEAEANRFSAGLLMPKPWFVKDMDKLGDADVTHVQKLAMQYGTSLEACANRYIELTDDSCAPVFSSDNVVRYIRRTDNFTFIALKSDDPLPAGCASIQAPTSSLRVATSWTEVDGGCWLEAKRGERVQKVLEQSIRQSSGFQTTLLFMEAVNDDSDDDADLEKNWTPRFYRG